MNALVLVNASLVNEGRTVATDVLVRGDRIERVGLGAVPAGARVVDLEGKHLLHNFLDISRGAGG